MARSVSQSPYKYNHCHFLAFEVIVRVIEKQHLDLSPIIRINDPRARIYEALHREPASGRYPTVLFAINILSARVLRHRGDPVQTTP